jgi:hypothetical protein
MPNHKIPIKDEEIIKQRIAVGASLRESIEGTSVKSPDTASVIAKENSDEIGQIREEYIKKIKLAGANDQARASLWAEMATATKPIGATILVDKDGKVIKAEDEGAITVPDWWAREKALRYIDALAGISRERNETPSVNVFTNPSFIKQYERS